MERTGAGLFIVHRHGSCKGLFHFGAEGYVPFAVLAECRSTEVIGTNTIGVVFIHYFRVRRVWIQVLLYML